MALKDYIPTFTTRKQRNEINKALIELKTELSIRPSLDELGMHVGSDESKRPRTLDLSVVREIADISPDIWTIRQALKIEVFRNGWELQPSNEDPNFEPDEEQKKELETLFHKGVNTNGQTFTTVMESFEDDLNVYDDAYLYLAKDYLYNETGQELIGAKIQEILRISPVGMEIIADEKGVLGKTDEGKTILVCPEHREKKASGEYCNACGCKTLPAHYKTVIKGGEELYYLAGEIIHASKYKPSLLFGTSPILPLWDKIHILNAQDTYFKKTYELGRPPKGLLFMKTRNQESLISTWNTLIKKTAENPNSIFPIGVETEGNGSMAEWVELMKNPEEMQLIEFRNELRRNIGAAYGVMPIWQGDLSTSGGLNNEGMQITVTNRAIEKAHNIYNNQVFPKIMKNFGITDWKLTLVPNEEKDEMAELQIESQKIANAQAMQSMGFEVTRNETGEFEYSDEIVNDPMQQMMGGGFGEGFSPDPFNSYEEPAGIESTGSPYTKGLANDEKTIRNLEAEANKILGKKFEQLMKKINIRRLNEAGRAALIGGLTKYINDALKKSTDKIIKDSYTAGLEDVAKRLGVGVGFTTIDQNRISVLQNSQPLFESYANMTASISKKVNNIINEALQKGDGTQTIVGRLKEEIGNEHYRMSRIARTETQHVSNVAREEAYKRVTEGQKFKWIGPQDHRTTEICNNIKKRTAKGVTLEELKTIVTEESKKGNVPGFIQREWTPHIHCRHTFIPTK